MPLFSQGPVLSVGNMKCAVPEQWAGSEPVLMWLLNLCYYFWKKRGAAEFCITGERRIVPKFVPTVVRACRMMNKII